MGCGRDLNNWHVITVFLTADLEADQHSLRPPIRSWTFCGHHRSQPTGKGSLFPVAPSRSTTTNSTRRRKQCPVTRSSPPPRRTHRPAHPPLTRMRSRTFGCVRAGRCVRAGTLLAMDGEPIMKDIRSGRAEAVQRYASTAGTEDNSYLSHPCWLRQALLGCPHLACRGDHLRFLHVLC